MFDYEIKIAETQDEIQAAKRLRFEVFKLEAGKPHNVEHQLGQETDEYDVLSEHLIIIDKSIERVIGNYRLLLKSKINGKVSFFSEKIFDIRNIKKLDGELLELGRSCVHPDYRSGPVINLLWLGLAEYIKKFKVKYIFGCPRINNSVNSDISSTMALLKSKYFSSKSLRVFPYKDNLIKVKDALHIEHPRFIYRKLPALVKGYLNLGACVCSEPAIYKGFNSVVVFMLLCLEEIKPIYRRHFFGS